MREDILVFLRDLKNHAVEAILLIVGIALGVGATTAGITVWAGGARMEEQLRTEPAYREIMVRPVTVSAQLDAAAMLITEEKANLSAADLVAREEAPDVAHAYVLTSGGHLRFYTEDGMGFGPPGGAPAGQAAEPAPPSGSSEAPASSRDSRSAGSSGACGSGPPSSELVRRR